MRPDRHGRSWKRRPSGAAPLTRSAPILAAAGLLLLVGTGVIAVAVNMSGHPDGRSGAEVSSSAIRESSATVTGTVEVPPVIGRTLADARVVLEAAGFKLRLSYDEAAKAASDTVLSQDPEPEARVPAGSMIRLIIAGVDPKVSSNATATGSAIALSRFVVVVDPGHQARSDSTPEPIGPGATVKKPRCSGGGTGIVTKVAEYEIALQLSMNLASKLEAAGIRVVMTRTTNDVNLSNAQRAAIANGAKAALFVRVHANGSTDSRVAGISTLYPASTCWTAKISAASRRAALAVQRDVVSSTDAPDRGLEPRSDLSGFNYARVPCVLVECGFLSNAVEDRLLASPHYQDKVARGIASGIVEYLESVR